MEGQVFETNRNGRRCSSCQFKFIGGADPLDSWTPILSILDPLDSWTILSNLQTPGGVWINCLATIVDNTMTPTAEAEHVVGSSSGGDKVRYDVHLFTVQLLVL